MISFQIKPRVAFGLPYLLIELFYIGVPVVRTDGRSGGLTVTWLPKFLGCIDYQIFVPMVLRCARWLRYKVMVCPIIEYACPVSGMSVPHQGYLSDKLESIQRNVSRWILGNDLECAECLEYLGWMELSFRREFLSLLQLFNKFINGLWTSELDKYLTFSCSNTRSSNRLKIAKPFSRTIILKYSIWRRYIYIYGTRCPIQWLALSH